MFHRKALGNVGVVERRVSSIACLRGERMHVACAKFGSSIVFGDLATINAFTHPECCDGAVPQQP